MASNERVGTSGAGMLDVLVAGAGFAGLQLLDRLRTNGFAVSVCESGETLGGVWYWSCYPGARVDTPSNIYQFSDERIWREWDWSDTYPSRDELIRYFEHVDEVLDLSRDITFGTSVVSARFDEAERFWDVETHHHASGERNRIRTRYLVLATGFGSLPYVPQIPGQESFAGQRFHTARWPQDGIDLQGKKLAVIGTGASGVQVVQTCAPEVDHLTVFQRTPNMALPMPEVPLSAADNDAMRAVNPESFAMRAHTSAGIDFDYQESMVLDLPPEEQQAVMERLWEEGGLKLWVGGFRDVLFDENANKIVYDFWRDKVRAEIDDPDLAEKLAPTTSPHPFGVKRCSLQGSYFKAFNRDNVSLVDVNETPVKEIVADGLVTADGRHHDADVIVYATGFDAVTGGLTAIDIVGTSGETLAEAFDGGVRTALGKATSAFPNLLYVYGPQSPSAFCNGPTCAEFESQWIADFLAHLREQQITRFDARTEAESRWGEHVASLVAPPSLFPKAKSWYMGANIPGKKVEIQAYPGGVPMYLQACEESAKAGYKNDFEMTP